MPPVVTIPPSPLGDVTDVNTSNWMQGPADAGLGVGFQWGPWYVPGALGGAAWYALTQPKTINTALQIYKSTDDRATWHLVAQTTINDLTQLWGAWMPSTGTVLSMVVSRTSDRLLRLLTFDFSTDTLGATGSSSGINYSTSGINQVQLIIQPSGLTFLFYDKFTSPSTYTTNYVTLSAGVWSGTTVLYTALAGNSPPNVPVASIVMESSGRFHGWICDSAQAPGSPQFWKYFQVSSVGVVGAVSTAYTADLSIIQQFFNGTHLAQIMGAQLFFPFSFTGQDNNIRMGCLIGTTLAAPTWQFVDVDPLSKALPQGDLGTQDYAERDGAAVLDINGNLLMFFDVMDNFNSGALANGGQIWYAQWNGATFNDPILFFDSVGGTVFPNQTTPPNGQATVFVLSIMPMQKADGSWTLMVSTAFDLPVFNQGIYNEVIYTRAITALSIACPVGGATATIGVPYVSAAPVVMGGTPPFTFSLVSGPAWMTINPSTGVVSGTPDLAGSISFVIKVTDSLGATATVAAPCPIVVSSPAPPPPPPFCITVPAGAGPTIIAYNEPTEQQGS